MNLDWSAEQSRIHDYFRSFGARWPKPAGIDDSELAGFSRNKWVYLAEAGALGLAVPTEYGGLGYDALTSAYALEGLGYSFRDIGLLMSVGAHMWAVEIPIMKFGNADQKDAYLPALCNGQMIGAHAITEPEAGSDALSLRTAARREGENYVLTGQKRFVTNGSVADLFIVYATINSRLGFTGVTAFLVERGQQGVLTRADAEKMGLRSSPWAELQLDECVISERQRLGSEKQGPAIFALTMAWERALILAPLLGAMARQVGECVEYAQARRQFGRRISAFQAVSHRIADMQLRLETARMLTYRACWDLSKGATGFFSEMAKLQTSEAAVAAFEDAMQIFGGRGYTIEPGIERDLRDALGTRIASGTADMQRSVIYGKLGLG